MSEAEEPKHLDMQQVEKIDIRKTRVRWGEFLIESSLGLCAMISIFTTGVIIFILSQESLGFFYAV
jgi:ABC-type phosphate transport system permease subunit